MSVPKVVEVYAKLLYQRVIAFPSKLNLILTRKSIETLASRGFYISDPLEVWYFELVGKEAVTVTLLLLVCKKIVIEIATEVVECASRWNVLLLSAKGRLDSSADLFGHGQKGKKFAWTIHLCL